MLKELRTNQNGIVFVTVLMIIIVMTVLTVSMISLNVNQSLLSEGEIKRIQAETIALGALAHMFTNLQLGGSSSNSITYPVSIGNVTYTVVANLYGSGLSGTYTQTLNIYVSY